MMGLEARLRCGCAFVYSVSTLEVCATGEVDSLRSARITVGPIQIRQVTGDTFLQLLHPRLELVVGKIAIPAVHGLELTAIDRHERIGEQVQAAAKKHELPAHAPNGRAIVLAEIRNCLEVR
jgi:hypothetical protein